MKRLAIYFVVSVCLIACSDESKNTDNESDKTSQRDSTLNDTKGEERGISGKEELAEFLASFPNRKDGRLWLHDSFFRKGRWDASIEISKSWKAKLGLNAEGEMKYLKFITKSPTSFVLAHITDYTGRAMADQELWYYRMGEDGEFKYKVKLAQRKWDGGKWTDKIRAEKSQDYDAYIVYADDYSLYKNVERKIIYMGKEESNEQNLDMVEAFMIDAEETDTYGTVGYFSKSGNPEDRIMFEISDGINNEYGFFEWPEMSFYVREGKLGKRYRLYFDAEDDPYEVISLRELPGGFVSLTKVNDVDSVGVNDYRTVMSYGNGGLRKFIFSEDPSSYDKVSFYFSSRENADGEVEYPVEYIVNSTEK